MGWNLYAIFIRDSVQTVNADLEFIGQLSGGGNVEPTGSKRLDEVIGGRDAEVYVGRYKDVLILVQSEWVISLVAGDKAEFFNRMVKQFPASEICAACLQGSVNLWGFSLIQNGVMIRAKGGSASDGTIVDEGKPLREEEFLSKDSKLDSDGKRLYRIDNEDEWYTEDQVGENIVFEVLKRFTGQSLDNSEDLLDSVFQGFALEDQELRYMLSGEWAGEYIFGEGYSQNLKGQSQAFTIHIREWARSVEGECIDNNKKDLAPATITGSFEDGILHFIKQYPFSPSRDKHGALTIDSSKPSPKILYVGGWDKARGIVFGIWEMERAQNGLLDFGSKKLTGTWRMRKAR